MPNTEDIIESALRDYPAFAGRPSWSYGLDDLDLTTHVTEMAQFLTARLGAAQQAAGLSDAERKDRDETRRLLYMALFVTKTERWNLAGTLAHALLHHNGPAGETDLAHKEAVMNYVLSVVQGDSRDWAFSEIARLTRELDANGGGITGEPGAL